MKNLKKRLLKILALSLAAAFCCGCEGVPEESSASEVVIAAEVIIPKEREPLAIKGSIDAAKLRGGFDTDTLYSEGVYMVNLDTDAVVVEKSPDKRLIPASLTKIMTALVCLENIQDLDAPVVCDEECFYGFFGEFDPNFDDASDAGIEQGQDNLTYRDCLYGLMLPSGCEAANVIAYNVCDGDMKAFVEKMNETAARIGCENTHFTNAHGLYEVENYSSAKDMYLITRYAMDNYPEFTKISCAVSYDMPANTKNPNGYRISHTNRMSRPDNDYTYDGVKGIKTGSINEFFLYNADTDEWEKADSCGVRGLVALCERDGARYLLSTVESAFYKEDGTLPEKQYPYLDHKALFDWALDSFEPKQIVTKGGIITSLPVEGGTAYSVPVATAGEISVLLPRDADPAKALKLTFPSDPDPLDAPVKRGDKVGELTVSVDGAKTVITLVAAENVDEALDTAA